MDVSATGQAVAAGVTRTSVDTVTGVVGSSSQGATTSVGASSGSVIPQAQSTPAPLPGEPKTLAPAVAKLFQTPAPPEPISLDVSYRVETDPNVIVTVFSDPKTGQEVASFPPEILLHVAQFFDQTSGVTLDRSA